MQFSISTLGVALVILVLLSAFFSGAEIGMMSLNRYRLRHLVKKNNKHAIRVNEMLSAPDKLLGVILIGNTVANIIASTLATLIGQRLYGDVGVALATLLLSLVILIFAELTPKTLAAIHPQWVAFSASMPLKWLQILLAPLVNAMSWVANTLLRGCGLSMDKAQKEALTGEELRSVVHESGGLLPIEHRGMLISLLDLEQATVEDIMVHKGDIVGLDLSQSWHSLIEQLETAQHTRLPLYRDTIDNLIGVVHVRDVLNLALEDDLNQTSLLNSADAPYFIPEATPLNVQILNFQKSKQRSCFVVDEYGELLGLVTMEDILEEVVGEFTTDIAALSKDILHQEDGSVIVDASITLRRFERLLNWRLPNLGPKTLSGVIIEYLGYIPPADSCLQLGDYRCEILKIGDNTIKTVKMIKSKRRELTKGGK